ncbi:hypothetical protein ACFXS9_10900 [Bradyrhizobium sp. RDI18]
MRAILMQGLSRLDGLGKTIELVLGATVLNTIIFLALPLSYAAATRRRSKQPTKKRPCGRFFAVASPALPIAGPVIIGI